MIDDFILGWTAIGEVFGVTDRIVKTWHEAGADILLLGNKPVTKLDDLWHWLKEAHKRPLANKSQ